MVTIKDVAKSLNIATSTVSYALNNDPRISEETKQRVLAEAKRLGYEGKSGKAHTTNAWRQVVIAVNSINGKIYSEIIQSLRKILAVNNCHLLVYIGKNVQEIKWMDGLIVLNSNIDTKSIKNVIARKIPTIVMDRADYIDNCPNILQDNFGGMYAVTKNLIERGAKTFAFVGGPSISYESGQRFEGFKKALEDHRLYKRDMTTLQSDFTYDGGRKISHFLLALPRMPDAIVCANDEMAAGIVDEFAMIRPGLLNTTIFGGYDGFCPNKPVPYATATTERNNWSSVVAYTLVQMFNRNRMESNTVMPTELVIQ